MDEQYVLYRQTKTPLLQLDTIYCAVIKTFCWNQNIQLYKLLPALLFILLIIEMIQIHVTDSAREELVLWLRAGKSLIRKAELVNFLLNLYYQ